MASENFIQSAISFQFRNGLLNGFDLVYVFGFFRKLKPLLFGSKG